jgi:hypothetical protein
MIEKPLWLAQEEICGLFERALAPNAVVHISTPRDRLDRAGNRRQLDVEVIVGTGNRQVRSIVEVQKRSEKVGINIYDGWIAKKERLNAALLICVSEAGFTDDVIAAATHDHPYDVKLGLLQEVDLPQINEHFVIGKFSHLIEGNGHTTYRSDFKLLTIDDRVIIVGASACNRPVFGQTSLNDIFAEKLGMKPLSETVFEVELHHTPTLTVPEIPDNPRIKKMKVALTHDVSFRKISLRTLLYRQVFPLEETIGACILADDVRCNNVAGNLAIISLPKPNDIEILTSFKTLNEELGLRGPPAPVLLFHDQPFDFP